MITPILASVIFLMAPEPNVTVQHIDSQRHSHGAPAGWVVTPSVGRADNCRMVIDAKRVLRGKPVTQSLPRKCQTRWELRNVHPDPAPRS
jgi:hypothetical protein